MFEERELYDATSDLLLALTICSSTSFSSWKRPLKTFLPSASSMSSALHEFAPSSDLPITETTHSLSFSLSGFCLATRSTSCLWGWLREE